MTICKQLELSDIELGQIIEAVTVRCSETHQAAPNYSNELFEIIVKLKSALLCPAPVVPSDDGDGAPLEHHYSRYESLKETVPVLDDDIPPIFKNSSLCPFCGSTFYRDDLGSCYDCFFPSDDRGE